MKSEIVISDGRVYHLGLAKGELARNVFLVGDPARAYRVSDRFDSLRCEIKNREYVTLTGNYKGMPVSVIGTGIGTDNVEIALIEAYAVNEINFETQLREPSEQMTFIRVGTSGGVQPDSKPGSLAIAQYALGLDSTGVYYETAASDNTVTNIENEAMKILDSSVSESSRFKGMIMPYASMASPDVVTALAQSAAARSVDFETGITVSSPGFYGPSSRFVEGLQNTLGDIKGDLAKLKTDGKRVINMEMESSILFHICGSLGHRSGTICPMISNPNTSDEIVDYDAAIEKTISVAIDAMYEIGNDG